MVKILNYIAKMHLGGTETKLFEITKNIDKTNFQFDYLARFSEEGYYDSHLIKMGSKIYYLFNNNFIKNFFKTIYILKKSKYDILIVHALNSGLPILIAAFFCGLKIRVGYARSSNNDKKFFLFKKILQYFSNFFINFYFAVSKESAEFFFGKSKLSHTFLLQNAFEIDKFRFSLESRVSLRKKFNCENKIVLGNIGRFTEAKNHDFLLSIVEKLSNHFILVLIGDGDFKNRIIWKIDNLKLNEKVVLLSSPGDVSAFYSMFDIFLLPSKYEGMPSVILEAQVSNLPSIMSSNITKDVSIIKDLNHYVNIGTNHIDKWVSNINKLSNGFENNRTDNSYVFRKNGFSLKESTQKFEAILLKIYNKNK